MDPRFKKFSKDQIVKAIMEMGPYNTDPLGIDEDDDEQDYEEF